MTPVLEKCKRCFGTGTVYWSTAKSSSPKKCPDCKGTCKVPVKESK